MLERKSLGVEGRPEITAETQFRTSLGFAVNAPRGAATPINSLCLLFLVLNYSQAFCSKCYDSIFRHPGNYNWH